ncbi:MAG: radical SAM protein, partial [Spirochaetota bacterium]
MLAADTRLSLVHESITLHVNKEGLNEYRKSRHPQVYGLYHELETDEAIFRFNLNGEIMECRGKDGQWPGSSDRLRRTAGGDWVFYSGGAYRGSYESFGGKALAAPIQFKIPSPYNEVYKATGEFYLPQLPYRSNSLLATDPFGNQSVQYLLHNWYTLVVKALNRLEEVRAEQMHGPIKELIEKIRSNTPEKLDRRAQELFEIGGDRVSVLPPETRHVEYRIIPLFISEGCLYKCEFCTVKNNRPFRDFSEERIKEQVYALRDHFGPELSNYNAVFLGNHDALNAEDSKLLWSARYAIEELNLSRSYMHGCSVMLFGSVDSFLGKDRRFFKELNSMGCKIYVNLGLESADQRTLDQIGKPITAQLVEESFKKMVAINDEFEHIEISANFLMGKSLPENHYKSFLTLVRDKLDHPRSKGAVYLSPILDESG